MATPKTLLSLAIMASMTTLSAPAIARERTAEINVDGLNLARPSVRADVQKRIERAVRNVCRGDLSRTLNDQVEVKQCKTNARAGAAAQLVQKIAQHKDVRKQAAIMRLKLASD